MAIIEGGYKWLESPADYDVRANLMGCSAQALNGNLSRGVPCDWATHGIGHAITAHYHLTHAETLAIILFGVWREQLDQKKAKLVQFGRRVWGLAGCDNCMADQVIAMTENFIGKIGLATRLSAYGLDAAEVAEKVAAGFRASGVQLGEQADIGHERIKKIILSRQ